MKTIFFALIASVFFLSSCEGPQGVPGRDGIDGEDGLIGEVFEVEASFTSSNNYEAIFDFDPPIYTSDKVLGYILMGADEFGSDLWEPLPQTLLVNQSIYQFYYDFSANSFAIYFTGNASLESFPLAERTNRVFRFLVVPAALVGKVNESNINDVMAKIGVNEKDVQNMDTAIH